jgi:hypothetical protein
MTIQPLRNSINHASLRRGVLLIALILTALGPPAAELSRAAGKGRGSPPEGVNNTFVSYGECGFDVEVTITGKGGEINLPNGGLILTAPTLYGTFTNVSDTTKSVTLNITGTGHVSYDENGDTIYTLTGRNGWIDPSIGLLLMIGNFTLVLDTSGSVISGPTGTGTIIDICGLIN